MGRNGPRLVFEDVLSAVRIARSACVTGVGTDDLAARDLKKVKRCAVLAMDWNSVEAAPSAHKSSLGNSTPWTHLQGSVEKAQIPSCVQQSRIVFT